MDFYCDIETIPDQSEGALEEVLEAIEAPAAMKKAETIEAWHNGEGKYAGVKLQAAETEWKKTGLSGTRGEIICISFALGDRDVINVGRTTEEAEASLLKDFFAAVEYELQAIADDSRIGGGYAPKISKKISKWIGHNITGFDLRFLWQRCVLNNVKPPFEIPYKAKPWDNTVFDTMVEWAGLHGKDKSQDAICKAMGYDGKGDIDGSKVWDYAKAGRYQEIYDYCDDDVEKVRLMHKRMTFTGE